VALADALARLITDAALRRSLADAGFERTMTMFSLQVGADRLAQRFAACLAAR
jgi:glycosyltransferase involved in cell wall biosynthesis